MAEPAIRLLAEQTSPITDESSRQLSLSQDELLRLLRDLLSSRLIDRDQFASRLSIGTSTFDKLRAAGVIGPRSVRVGGAVRWELREVEAYLAARDPAGELYDADTWPAVWADRQKGGRK